MQLPKAFTIDADALATAAEPADRLVYVSHFVPCALPKIESDEPFALTPSQIDKTARTAALVRDDDGEGLNGSGRLPNRVRQAAARWRERAETAVYVKVDTLTHATVLPTVQIEGQLGTEFRWLFLDRTRIRPMGFALGEHLTSLSLAPGEEVTIEQRTFSKLERSFEEIKDSESTRDLELSSSYTNELGESLDWQVSLSKKSSNSSGIKGNASYEGAGVEASNQTASDLSDGDTRTSRDSLKLSETSTRKVASKQRQQHKTVMKLSQESRFESGSKRVIRNANELAPVDLVYFKVMQRLRLSQERFGVRLCWAPTVADPAGRLLADLERRRLAFLAVATAIDAGPAPLPPAPPVGLPQQTIAVAVKADRFDWAWGGQSDDYTIDLVAPANYTWDRQPLALTSTFTGSRPSGCNLLVAVGTATGVRAFAHVGIEDCRNPTKPQWWQPQGTFTLILEGNFLPNPNTAADQAYADKFVAYLEALNEWKARAAAMQADADAKAEASWATIRNGLLARVNVVQEVMGSLVEQAFPRAMRDEPWEIDLWERIFDFGDVTVRFYPAWWNGGALRDPDGGSTSFLNASWARIYLPVRPNAEDIALRWLLARLQSGKGTRSVEATVRYVIAELKKYRLANFGSEDELAVDPDTMIDGCPSMSRPYRCLGTWDEVIPTDGTHLEILQATSSAADDYLAVKLAAQNEKLVQQAALAGKDVAIKTLVSAANIGAATSHVEIRVPETKNDD